MSDVRSYWPGRPTRAAHLAPRGIRERLGSRIARSLVERYDHELGAETLRSDAGWESAVAARRVLRERTGAGEWPAAPKQDGEPGEEAK